MKQIITSLDLGSNSIKLIVGEIYKNKLFVLSSSEVFSSGIKKGVVTNEEKASEALKEAFKRCEDVLGIKIDKVVLVVPSYSASFVKGEGYTTIDRSDNTVTGKDITKALQASVYNRVSKNLELVSVTPVDFIINEEQVVRDPRGMEATRLNVNSILGMIPSKSVDGIINILEKNGIKVVDLAFGGISDYYEFRTNDMAKKQVAVINIGEYKTEVSLIKEDLLIGIDVLDLGGRNIDRDISYAFDITLANSKVLKEEFALAYKSKSSTNEIVEVTNKEGVNIKINQYEISEIAYLRIKDILEEAKKSINHLTKGEISYIIITGGTTEMEGFSKVFSESFGANSKMTTVEDLGVRNNKYSTALGVIKLYSDKLKFRDKVASTVSADDQEMLFSEKKKNSDGSLLGKVYSYFFDN